MIELIVSSETFTASIVQMSIYLAKKSAKRSKQQDFHLNNNKLDIVQKYTYLEVKLSSIGNFTTNQTQSREKALHAFYNLTRIIDLKRLKPKHSNKLFETLIVPILSYGCEVWGAYLKQTFQNWEKSPIEKVYLRFCKYYLGVNGKATNTACRAELGRFPLKLVVDLRIVTLKLAWGGFSFFNLKFLPLEQLPNAFAQLLLDNEDIF